jgi:hypothetical protein
MTYSDAPSITPLSNLEVPLESWPLSEESAEVNDDGSEGTLSSQMTRALIMMVEGKKIADIADKLRVHRVTVYRWTTHPAFQRELNFYRDRLIEETFSLQVLASKRASLRLLELMEDDNSRTALNAVKTAAPLKDAYVALDRERRVRFMEDNLDAS